MAIQNAEYVQENRFPHFVYEKGYITLLWESEEKSTPEEIQHILQEVICMRKGNLKSEDFLVGNSGFYALIVHQYRENYIETALRNKVNAPHSKLWGIFYGLWKIVICNGTAF
ncbi:MAG: hypothetical protein HFH69_13845 [Lachnospiraceae bacterium]|nr:hypothetical protein [Lachnospiraceae bacterium]